jgi:hypothetical protein
MKHSHLTKTLLFFLLGAGLTSAAQAGPLWEFSNSGSTNTYGTWDFATAFTANKDLTVSALGYYAGLSDTQTNPNPVALYQCSNADCTGTATLLALTSVSRTAPVTGHFRYTSISPVSLLAGFAYEIAGVSLSNEYTWDDPGFSVDPTISLIALNGQVGRWQYGSTPDFISQGQSGLGSADGLWGPNVFIKSSTPSASIPEPSSFGIFALGLGVLWILRRKQCSAERCSAAA